ncbi:MAG: hypothetical protein C9356_02705 [Oleiphilus sp.]|nr:MAG: hypothetical protein C9356_02705 [Oleiphilus sp.]
MFSNNDVLGVGNNCPLEPLFHLKHENRAQVGAANVLDQGVPPCSDPAVGFGMGILRQSVSDHFRVAGTTVDTEN